MRRKGIEQAKQNTMQGHYDNITEYAQRQIEAERKFIDTVSGLGLTTNDIDEYKKESNGKFAEMFKDSGDIDYDVEIDGKAIGELQSLFGEYDKALKKRNDTIEKWQAKIDEEQAELDSVDTAFSSLYGDLLSGQPEQPSYTLGGENYKSSAQMAAEEYAANYKSLMLGTIQEIADAQADSTEALKSGWDNLNHAYAIGVIASDEELYARKSALLEEYGNENLSDHWKYYEELYDYQQEFSEKSQKASEEAAEAERNAIEAEWNRISNLANLGVISAEDAYIQQLEWIKKYCPEYADEWQSYYKSIVDYQREAMTEQVEGVKSSLSETLNEYKKQ